MSQIQPHITALNDAIETKDDQQQVKVLFGTCGWSYDFYPKGCSDVAEKLEFIQSIFSAVEVNTSTYAIPHPSTTEKWVKCTCPGFIFHFKAYGLFCSRGISTNNLPHAVRELLPPQLAQKSYINLSELPSTAIDKAWEMFHACLEPVYQANKLGCVMFQMQLTFTPSEDNLQYILYCRRQLDSKFQMAVEFRCRQWFVDGYWRDKIQDMLSRHGIALVAADELEHETFQKDREQRGLAAGQVRRVLPIATLVTTPEFGYARIHRRHGTVERLFDEEEIERWVGIIKEMAAKSKGPMPFYVNVGTDFKDAPIRNAKALHKALPENLRYDWRPPKQRVEDGPLGKLFKAAAAAGKRSTTMAANDVDSTGMDEDERLARLLFEEEKQAKKFRKSEGQPKGIASYFSKQPPG